MASGLDREAVVEEIKREADSVLSFRLRLKSGDEFPSWEPGAHIAVCLPNGLTRQYSLCGYRDDGLTLSIAVLREPASRGGSAYLHEMVSVGDVLGIGEIRNNFPLVGASTYVFVAGGIGITPMIPMIEQIDAAGSEWRLVYGGKSRSSMAYVDRLAQYGRKVAIRPQEECGLLDFEADVTAGLPDDAVVYACGPEAMLSALSSHCSERGVPLHIERFRASEEVLVGTGANKPFMCELARTGKQIQVGVEESIVDALERCGIFPKSDCREGTCGSCETSVLRGSVEHRDALLDETERAESKTMMICVSRATTDVVVLDL